MKLNILFLLMDLLTLLAYPIIFVHGKLYQYFKPREIASLLAVVPVMPERWSSRKS